MWKMWRGEFLEKDKIRRLNRGEGGSYHERVEDEVLLYSAWEHANQKSPPPSHQALCYLGEAQWPLSKQNACPSLRQGAWGGLVLRRINLGVLKNRHVPWPEATLYVHRKKDQDPKLESISVPGKFCSFLQQVSPEPPPQPSKHDHTKEGVPLTQTNIYAYYQQVERH